MSIDRRLAALVARAVESNSRPAPQSDWLARKYQAMASSMVANWDRLGPIEQMSHAERMVLSLLSGVNVMAPQSEFDNKVRAEAEHARDCLAVDRRARRWETKSPSTTTKERGRSPTSCARHQS